MLTLKRFSILTILSLGLLVSQSALAGTEDISEDLDMQERNTAIVNYLEEKLARGDDLAGDDTAFFLQHPEYVIEKPENDQELEKIETRTLDLPQTNALAKITTDSERVAVEVAFYSDGSYIVEELEKKMLEPKTQLVLKSGEVISPVSSVLGQNTHHIYNTVGVNIGRTYVEAQFYYNGTSVYYGERRGANTRSLDARYRVYPGAGYQVMSYPSEYNGKICRAQYISNWYKIMPTYELPVLMDTNRVSCNHQGKIFTTSPGTAG